MQNAYAMRALFIIVSAGHADDVIEIARNAGAGGATILNARGEGLRHEVFMGITIDTEKEIILCLVDAPVADKIMESVREKAGKHTPVRAVLFSVPIDQIVGITQPAPVQ